MVKGGAAGRVVPRVSDMQRCATLLSWNKMKEQNSNF